MKSLHQIVELKKQGREQSRKGKTAEVCGRAFGMPSGQLSPTVSLYFGPLDLQYRYKFKGPLSLQTARFPATALVMARTHRYITSFLFKASYHNGKKKGPAETCCIIREDKGGSLHAPRMYGISYEVHVYTIEHCTYTCARAHGLEVKGPRVQACSSS